MVVIGISPELDVLESLEKRVRSRFNHRQIEMFPPKTFDEYFNIAKGQFISKCPLGVIVSTKKPTKFF